jgi:hypothetical protein
LFSYDVAAQGKVIIKESQAIKAFMEQFIKKNKENKTISGWRVQIVSTDDRREMDQIRSKFIGLYPDEPLTWKHVSPYYQVRVGAFKTKSEMMPFLYELKKIFPTAIPVQENIDKFDLIKF